MLPGKTVSCGAIVLYCLNLPPHLRFRPENVCIIGLTPSPLMPNPTTISHLLAPIIESVLAFSGNNPPAMMTARNFSIGVPVRVKVAPMVSDLGAGRKAGGFLSHSADLLCSYCLCTQNELGIYDITYWTLRDGATVRQQASEWQQAKTLTARHELESKNGVRWTPFHLLPYWNPVDHLILGFMHNWLEGVLQDQLRRLWGIGRTASNEDVIEKVGTQMEEDEVWTESDISESADEVEDLMEDMDETEAEYFLTLDRDIEMEILDLQSHASSSTPMQTPETASDGSLHDSDYQPLDDHAPLFTMSDEHLQAIRCCIADITLPTWIKRPPTNLGEPSHGKLKARDYLTLFSSIFPLIIPEVWHGNGATTNSSDMNHLGCFYSLVAATNIVSSFSVSSSDADQFAAHYCQYRKAVAVLFPHWHAKPNHHYAMHYCALLKLWGPLASFSEFPGERLNGLLQRVKTNHQYGMLTIVCIF
jgi:hypothetical protein